MRWEEYRPSKTVWFWSCIICLAIVPAVGFGAAGWVTGATATQMADTASDQAQAKLAASFCVARFENSPNAVAEFAALKKTDDWKRDDFITSGGWVTPPGTKQPITDAADLCVQQLMSAKLPPAKSAASPG
jgi:hypothetical protein